jgi:hypothetical protein
MLRQIRERGGNRGTEGDRDGRKRARQTDKVEERDRDRREGQ